MVNDKYKLMMIDRINTTIQAWEQLPSLKEQELYTFLHNLKGTAGSIGMVELSEIASMKLEELSEKSDKLWSVAKWKPFIRQIEEIASFIETNIQPITSAEAAAIPAIGSQKNFILVIDDDMVFASFIKSTLEAQGLIVIVAQNGQRGLELIYELRPALVFLDIHLPDINGYSILENINKVKSNYMFVAMMSVNDSNENRQMAYELGAFDFIKKPFNEQVLAAYVKNRLSYKQTLEHSIVTDELTQVYNRKYMNTQLEILIEQYDKNDERFSLVIADIDFFKKVNDTYGHVTGDEVLKGFAALIMAEKREEDLFCRYGGEEFVLIMPNTSKSTAFTLIERLRKQIGEQPFYSNGTAFHITFSSGISEVDASNRHPKTLLEQADQALYRAKSSGRNQTALYTNGESFADVKKVKLIVIDDVAIIRNLITGYFSQLKLPDDYLLEVESYESGVKFLQSNWYEKNTKYVLLLDGMMPDMDGIDVLKEIRKTHQSNEVIISMLTGRNDERYVYEALSNGADDFIVKPFNLADISKRILQLVNQLFMKVRQ